MTQADSKPRSTKPRVSSILLILCFLTLAAAVHGARDPQIGLRSSEPLEVTPLEITSTEAEAQNQDAYDPGARRDPFKSPRQKTEPEQPSAICGEGTSAVRVDDVSIEAIFVTSEGAIAQVRSYGDRPALLLRDGDPLCDGDVVSVEADRIVLKQEVAVSDEVLRPFREVVKRVASVRDSR